MVTAAAIERAVTMARLWRRPRWIERQAGTVLLPGQHGSQPGRRRQRHGQSREDRQHQPVWRGGEQLEAMGAVTVPERADCGYREPAATRAVKRCAECS